MKVRKEQFSGYWPPEGRRADERRFITRDTATGKFIPATCASCGKRAVAWNPYNHVRQCYRCGHVA